MTGMVRRSMRCVLVSVAVLALGTTVRASSAPIPPLTVTSISPATGSTAGGTAVTLTIAVSFFAPGFSPKGAITTVTIGGAAATNVVVVSATSITATTPAGTVGAKDVVVTTGSGSGTLTNGFTYITDVPTLPEWALIFLALALGGLGYAGLRQGHPRFR